MKPFFKETNRQLGIELSQTARFMGYLLALGVGSVIVFYLCSLVLSIFHSLLITWVVAAGGWFYLKRVARTMHQADYWNRRILPIDDSGRVRKRRG